MSLAFAAHVTAATPARPDVILATTTSTQDSGLLDLLVPMFEKRSGYRVKTIAVGSGQALAMAARGDADVALSHAPAVELRYVKEGALVNRRPVMHNDFVIVGPPGDTAGIRGTKSMRNVFRRIAETGSRFASRADGSGTDLVERELWEHAGVKPAAPWYVEAGQGMGATLNIASEKGAYALTDRATFLALRPRLHLALLFEGSRRLMNAYDVLESNPRRFPRVNAEAARALADFLVSAEAQTAIAGFGVERFGQPLFFPDAAAVAGAVEP